MAKIMVFIDGTWLYSNHRNLVEAFGDDFQIDYGKLPMVLGKEISENLGGADVDMVRTYLFGSNAKNYSDEDRDMVYRRKDFFNLLREEYHYDVDVFEIDYRGRRLRRKDRDPEDDFSPEEKCVDIALASSMLYYAALPYAYDIAILVGGDRDYIPLLHKVRSLGKRIAIASIKNSCPREFRETYTPQGLRDFDMIWLDSKEMMTQYKLEMEAKWHICRSPLHAGENPVWTDEFVRKSRPYYCKDCRETMRKQREETMYTSSNDEAYAAGGTRTYSNGYIVPEAPTEVYTEGDEEPLRTGDIFDGIIKKLMDSFGFINTEVGDFYFTMQDMAADQEFHYLQPGTPVEFTISRLPNPAFRGGRGNGNAEEVKVIS